MPDLGARTLKKINHLPKIFYMNNFYSLMLSLILLTACQSKDYLGDEKVAANVDTSAAASTWTKTGSDIYYSSGNVGVGVIAPSEALDVAGNIKLSTNNNGLKNSAGNFVIKDNSNTISIGNASTTATEILDGKVGLGIAPAFKFDVLDSITATSGWNVTQNTYTTVAPSANQAQNWADFNIANYSYIEAPVSNTYNLAQMYGGAFESNVLSSNINVNYLYGSYHWAANRGTGNTFTEVAGGWAGAINTGTATGATIGHLYGYWFGVQSDAASTINKANGIWVENRLNAGTITDSMGIRIDSTIVGATVTNRYGVYLTTPTGAATNDFGFYQPGTQTNVMMGALGVGTNNPSEKLHVVGNILASGTITPSDERLKKNIKNLESNLEKVSKIRAVSYDWKDTKHGKGKQLGVVAQEIQKVYPEVVTKTNDGFLAVSYNLMIAPLIGAVGEIRDILVKHDKAIVELQSGREPASSKEIKLLQEENAMLKEHLCKTNPSYSFCKGKLSHE